jgi:hypothetical protein
MPMVPILWICCFLPTADRMHGPWSLAWVSAFRCFSFLVLPVLPFSPVMMVRAKDRHSQLGLSVCPVRRGGGSRPVTRMFFGARARLAVFHIQYASSVLHPVSRNPTYRQYEKSVRVTDSVENQYA